MMESLPPIADEPDVRDLIRRALAEDVGPADVTTLALVDAGAVVRAVIEARQPCVVAGAGVAAAVFGALDPRVRCTVVRGDGAAAAAGDTLLELCGSARAILTGERTALNLLQRLSGVATLTRRFVDSVAAYGTLILDTRKTTPGLRRLEKYAVRCGGGTNHRMGLYDRALIKDNHRQLWRAGEASRLDLAVSACRRAFPGLEVEVEVETEAELRCALRASPEWVLLDNQTPEELRRLVPLCKGISRVEASGGITLANVEAVAATGVDAISLGCLTHSAPAVDLSLEIAPAPEDAD